jgi:hypothetical protein
MLAPIFGGVALVALTGAQQPSALAGASAGEWELTGVPGAKGAVRECVVDLMSLTQYEHRGRHCTSKVISDRGTSVVVQYSCGGSDFGRTQIDVLTPRSLRVSTQGISQSLPFNYVLQARRMGDCTKGAAPSRH